MSCENVLVTRSFGHASGDPHCGLSSINRSSRVPETTAQMLSQIPSGISRALNTPSAVPSGQRASAPDIRRTRTGRRAVSRPPQAYEGDTHVLTYRLLNEGADPDVVDIIRYSIFGLRVTERALKAPIESRELSLRHGGVKLNWHLLLQVKKATAGNQSYCCRVCPPERRPEYKNAPDALRHLERDHFGLSVVCQYW